MIRAVLLDLDETLLVRQAAIRAFIADQYRRHTTVLTGIAPDLYAARFLELEDEGRRPKVAVYPALAAEFGLPDQTGSQLLADYQALYPRYAVVAAGAIETLDALRSRGLKTGIVTNGNATVQNGKIDHAGLRPLVDTVLVSDTEGVQKPVRRIFELAVQRLGVSAGEAIFVGDNPAVDVDGSRNAGLTPVWYHSTTDWPAGMAPPLHTITTMAQLLPLLDRLDPA